MNVIDSNFSYPALTRGSLTPPQGTGILSVSMPILARDNGESRSMASLRVYLPVLAAVALTQLGMAESSLGAQQAIKKKSDCAAVGGKAGPNPYSTGEYPFLCIYPDKYDRQCQRKMDETAYYDIAQKKCVSELMCDLEGIC